MRLLIQRVTHAQVITNNQLIGKIEHGLLLFLAIHRKDDKTHIRKLIDKVIYLRIFEDQQGKMTLSIRESRGKILLISQFTLYANCQKGRRPSFADTASFEEAKILYEIFAQELRKVMGNAHVATGKFGTHMQIELINDGPVTLLLDS